jgi:hypothetical protein
MVYPELMCQIANDRIAAIRREAEMERLAACLRPPRHGVRAKLARTLHTVAEWLEPNVADVLYTCSAP